MIVDNRFIRLNNTQYAYDLIDDAFDLKRDWNDRIYWKERVKGRNL